ncbi:molybdopterin cofactor-binding domain-containing protein [Phenylobacterium sp.]|uniref:xanthine dehydrogenase family protein molybdopterin-binding subunit n=1 Tax=Phenylobacterium sp. TaxID=1871053 RepID=UPI0028117837|nr:molybdopterin cofactor-binding domain-containing protein [Phenylobacterium sp.]
MAAGLSRRGVLAGLGGAGLTLGLGADGALAGPGATATLSDWVRISPDGTVTLYTSVQEMGQGAWCVHARLLAEELNLAWEAIRVEQAPPLPVYGIFSPGYGTGGSSSVREMYGKLRRVGAAARVMLIEEAAERWKVPAADCAARGGAVVHTPTGRTVGFGALAEAAAKRRVPQDPPLKPRSEWSLIGSEAQRKDLPPKVDGSAVYAIDVRLAGLLTATLQQAPQFGAKLKSVDHAPALAIPGVRRVLEMRDFSLQVPGQPRPYLLPDAVVVVADGFWAAKKGLEALSPVWEEDAAAPDTDGLLFQLKTQALSKAVTATPRGAFAPGEREALQASLAAKAEAALSVADRRFEQDYVAPLLAHAPMEPLSAAARIKPDGGAEAWGGFQNTSGLRLLAATLLGVEVDRIEAHTLFSGGSFGRRYKNDYGLQAVWAAREMGAPVKLIWSREEDIRQDWYRPAGFQRLTAGLDRQGRLTALKIVGANNNADYTSGMVAGPPHDLIQYAGPAMCMAGAYVNSPVPGGPWRSVLHTGNAFAVECFLDELAHETGIDPIAFRRPLLAHAPRAVRVMEHAAKAAGWGRRMEPGRGLGLAVWSSFSSVCAQVVEAHVADGKVKVEQVWCAFDPGTAAHPDAIRQQGEGSILMALTSAATGEINLRGGRVVESNFHDYPLMRLAQAPRMQIDILESPDAPVGGAGEPMTPPLMPALANAICAATGRRLRTLPLTKAGLTLV